MRQLFTVDAKVGIDWMVLFLDTLFVLAGSIIVTSFLQPTVQIFVRGLGSAEKVTFWQVFWPILAIGILLWLLVFWFYKKKIANRW